MTKIVLALSGGVDSTTLLFKARKEGHDIFPVFIDYGSKHNCYELHSAERILAGIGMPRELARVDLRDLFCIFKSSLLSSSVREQEEIPEAHYNDPVQKATVVPGRNLIIVSILAAIAQSLDPNADEVWMGMHTGDFEIYLDCTPDWYENVYRAIQTQSEGKVVFRAPWIDLNLDKVAVVRKGLALSVPFHVVRTCYKNQPVACGKCGACRERLEAFKVIGVEDPLRYES